MNRPRRPGARSVQLWGRGRQAGTGERFWPPKCPHTRPILWVWQSSWQGHYKRGQEVIVTETYLTKGLFLGTQLVEVMCTTHSGF